MATTLIEENPTGESIRTDLEVSGMTCQNCARHVREALESVPGVGSAVVSLPNQSASVRWDAAEHVNVDALLRSLDEAGYPARSVEKPSTAESHHHHSHAWEINLWIGVIGTFLLMVGEWGF